MTRQQPQQPDELADNLIADTLDELVERAIKGLAGNYGHPGRPGQQGGAGPHTAVSRMRGLARRFRAGHEGCTCTVRPADATKQEEDAAERMARAVAKAWAGKPKALAGRIQDGPKALVAAAKKAWRGVFTELREKMQAALLEEAQGSETLADMAEAMLETFVGQLIERRLAPAIEAMAEGFPEQATAAEKMAAAEVILERVPALFDQAYQPAWQRTHSYGTLRRLVAESVAKGEAALDLIPEGVSRSQRYRIVTAGDSRVCPVCEQMESLRGSFRLTDALAEFDAFVEAVEEDGMGDAVERVPFPRFDDVDGLNATELSRLGVMVPPFHPRCRCQVVFVGKGAKPGRARQRRRRRPRARIAGRRR